MAGASTTLRSSIRAVILPLPAPNERRDQRPTVSASEKTCSPFRAGRGRITARIDDRSVVDAPAIAAAPTSDQLRVVVGIYFAGEASVSGWAFRFDDVRLDGN